MDAFKKISENSQKLVGCWHGSNLYVKAKPNDKYYSLRFEKCDRVNRGSTDVDVLDFREALIGTKKIYKIVVQTAGIEDSRPFLIIAESYTLGQFNPQQGSDDGQGHN